MSKASTKVTSLKIEKVNNQQVRIYSPSKLMPTSTSDLIEENSYLSLDADEDDQEKDNSFESTTI